MDSNIFLFAGKREDHDPFLDRLSPANDQGEPSASRFRDTLRFPIYVHSKMIIVDDAYILGKVSHKYSLVTIFGHKHFRPKF